MKEREVITPIADKTFTTTSGRRILVYDDVFTYNQRTQFLIWLRNSFFKVTGADYGSGFQVYSNFSEDDMKNMGFYSGDRWQQIDNYFGISQAEKKQIRINYSYSGEPNQPHTDLDGMTVLYYANTDWHVTWGGCTQFFNESLTEIEFSSVYKPGRLIIFDGAIPHMIATTSPQAAAARFTIALQTKAAFPEENNRGM